MATRAEKNSFMEEFLFKEKEGKLFVFKKHSPNQTKIREHVKNVFEFIKLFTFGENEKKDELQLFQKYFDDEINKEIKSNPSYDCGSEIFDDYIQRMFNLLEKKESKKAI